MTYSLVLQRSAGPWRPPPGRWMSTTVRYFSDDRRGGGRGRGGAGGRGGRGRVSGALDRFREERSQEKFHRGGPPKPNFAKMFLEAPARGELNRKHESGIPKLAARKGKSSKVHDLYPGKEAEQIMDEFDDYEQFELYDDDDDVEDGSPVGLRLPGAAFEAPPDANDDDDAENSDDSDDSDEYLTDEESDSEAEFDEFEPFPNVRVNKWGVTVIGRNPNDKCWGYDPDEDNPYGNRSMDDIEEQFAPEPKEPKPRPQRKMFGGGGGGGGDDDNDEENFEYGSDDEEPDYYHRSVYEMADEEDDYSLPKRIANRVVPIADHGSALEDFLEAMVEHPTRFASYKRLNPHSESRREPKPDFPPNRLNPPLEFVTSHKRFIYVTGLPLEGDFDNPLHRHEIVKLVARIFQVKSDHVSPANMTSAFIGYKIPAQAYCALDDGPVEKKLPNPVHISLYSKGGHEDFANEAPNCVVELTNLPRGSTAENLAESLFPPITEVGAIYGPLSPDQILITSPKTALIRFDSPDKAHAAVGSDLVRSRLEAIGERSVRYFRARREIVRTGYTGPNNAHEMKRFGPRLVVTGDCPSKQFFMCHAGVIQLRNLDESVTKEDLAKVFQPFCLDRRDVLGSVEFVTCAEGIRTDRAFVGFDYMGEAEAAMKGISGKLRIGRTVAHARTVRDKKVVRGIPREARSSRNEVEILDNLNNWEQYVDPKDIEDLEALGVRRELLDNAFRSMRFHNATFGPSDLAMRRERLEPERATGVYYRDAVREYIDTLKECMATPEDPGLLYKGFFHPDEQVDLSIFDNEKVRQERLHKKLLVTKAKA